MQTWQRTRIEKYLKRHETHCLGNSWNGGSVPSRIVKLQYISNYFKDKTTYNRVWDFLNCEEVFENIQNCILDDFKLDYPGYQIDWDGRSEYCLILSHVKGYSSITSPDIYDYDEQEDYEDALKIHFRLLRAFDRTVERTIRYFANFVADHKMVKKIVQVSKEIMVCEKL